MTTAQRVFISYSRSDRSFVAIAIQLLRAGGAAVFYDAISIEFGDRWEAQLQRAISQCERVLVFWSAAAANSAWVDREWRQAAALRKRIVPLQLDQTPMPQELAQFHGITGLLETLREALGPHAPSSPPASGAIAAPPEVRSEIPDDWDPFAPDLPSESVAPAARPPAAPVSTPVGGAANRDAWDALFGASGTTIGGNGDPLSDFTSDVPSIELERGRRFTTLLFTGA